MGKVIARVDGVIGDTAAKKYWYHSDQVGSVKAVTNQAGAVVWKADYLPFGTQFGKNKLDPEFEEDDLGFTGKGYDKDVGLYYFNARWYDAELGRFISEDPVADPNNPNLYTYCANNPLTNIDPTGLQATLGDIGLANPGGTGYDASIPVGSNGGISYSYNYQAAINNRYPEILYNIGLSELSLGDETYNNMHFAWSLYMTVTNGVTGESKTYNLDRMKSDLQTLAALQNMTTNGDVSYEHTIRDRYKAFWDYVSMGNTTIVGLRGWGIGGGISDYARAHGEHDYNDMLIVIVPGKPINVFSRCNFEGSTFNGGNFPNIADGIYGLNLGWHKRKYAALWVNNNGPVKIQQVINPITGNPYMTYCHIHRGGENSTWSEGCITIWAPNSNMGQWNRFSGLLPSNSIAPNYYGITEYRNPNNYYGLQDGRYFGTLNIMTF